MDFLLYFTLSTVYIMTIHFAIAIKSQFNVWLMGGFFVLGAVIGWYYHSWEVGFTLSVILSLIFW